MNENIESKYELLIKWLRILLYIHIASIFNRLVSFLPVAAVWTLWISRAIMVGVIICMFQLASVNARYKKAAVFRAVMLGCTLITAYLFQSTLLTLAASIISILAVYQEYSAHAELVANKDSGLSRKWHSLFNWGIVSALLTSFGSIVTALIITMMGMNGVRTSSIIVGILSIPQFIIDVVYLLYVWKMICVFQDERGALE